jgi:hypothetical protein
MLSFTIRLWRSTKVYFLVVLLHFSLTTIYLGCLIGDRLSLSEVQELVDNDETLQDLSSECQQELIDELVEYRKLKNTGACVSNVAVASDIRVTMGHISDEVCRLFFQQRAI